MKKIAIVTDSNSGITQKQGEQMGIFILPMPFFIDGELFLEDITLTQEEFYKRLGEDSDISTSQPSPADVLELWDRLLEEYDEVVHIPMSSGLSSSCETAVTLSQDYDGRVQVVDNQRISVTQVQAVLDAIKLKEAGKPAAEMKYLKKGGRITPAAAALGTVLNLKPVLQIQGEKLDAFAKVRGWKAAKRTMLKAIETDLAERFAGKENQMVLGMAYTCSKEEAEAWKQEIHEKFPQHEIIEGPLSLSVACHIGAGAMAVTCMKKVVTVQP